MRNMDTDGDWKVLQYQDGVQVSAYQPHYALNLRLDRKELLAYCSYLLALCASFALIDYLVSG